MELRSGHGWALGHLLLACPEPFGASRDQGNRPAMPRDPQLGRPAIRSLRTLAFALKRGLSLGIQRDRGRDNGPTLSGVRSKRRGKGGFDCDEHGPNDHRGRVDRDTYL